MLKSIRDKAQLWRMNQERPLSSEAGFSLIELLIVLALIAVLSMFGMPIYRNYLQSAHVTEGMNLASGAKMELELYYMMNGRWPSQSEGNEDLGLPKAEEITGSAVQSVAIKGGEIEILYNEKVTTESGSGQGTIRLIADGTEGGSIHWRCMGRNIPEKSLPKECRP